MLIYHSAFDMYHSVFRMIQLLSNLKQDYVELERLRIWDYYLAFPNEMTKIRYEKNNNEIRNLMSRRFSPYEYSYDNPIVFVDPDGMLAKSFIDELWNKSGNNTTWTNNHDGTFSGDNGETASTGGDEQGNPITPVNDKNKKNISKVSWGETEGIYPVKEKKDKDGKKIKPKSKDLFNPATWDPGLLKQLLKARAAINVLATRNSDHHTDSPNLNTLSKN